VKRKLLPPIFNNEQGFAIMVFALAVVVLIAFGIANMELGADKQSKATTNSIVGSKIKKELDRYLRMESLLIKEKLIAGNSGGVENIYKCSNHVSIEKEKKRIKRVLTPQKSILLTCKITNHNNENGYLLSAYMLERDAISKEFAQVFINQLQGAIGSISRALGTVSKKSNTNVTTILAKDAKIYIGDTIKTGSASTTTLQLNDNSTILLGANTSFLINEFKAKTADQRVGVFTTTAGFIKAWIRKKQVGQRVLFKTKRVAMGVRGTTFTLATIHSDEIELTETLITEGEIEVLDQNENPIGATISGAPAAATARTEQNGLPIALSNILFGYPVLADDPSPNHFIAYSTESELIWDTSYQPTPSADLRASELDQLDGPTSVAAAEELNLFLNDSLATLTESLEIIPPESEFKPDVVFLVGAMSTRSYPTFAAEISPAEEAAAEAEASSESEAEESAIELELASAPDLVIQDDDSLLIKSFKKIKKKQRKRKRLTGKIEELKELLANAKGKKKRKLKRKIKKLRKKRHKQVEGLYQEVSTLGSVSGVASCKQKECKLTQFICRSKNKLCLHD
jgi:hypothetical protein